MRLMYYLETFASMQTISPADNADNLTLMWLDKPVAQNKLISPLVE
jgi:hypothetical protein